MLYKYKAGASGTVVMETGSRVVGWAAHAPTGGATMTINAGETIIIPANTAVMGTPDIGQNDLTFVFTDTDAYLIEYMDRVD